MSEIIRFFTSDLSSLLFAKEPPDKVSGFPCNPPETTQEAWRIDRENLSRDGKNAVKKVLHEQEAKKFG